MRLLERISVRVHNSFRNRLEWFVQTAIFRRIVFPLAVAAVCTGALLVALVLFAMTIEFTRPSMTTNTRSQDLPLDKRIPFLSKYIKLKSSVEAAEFHIKYQDNSHVLPAPSSWDIRAIIKVRPDAVDVWTEGFQPANTADLSWGDDLLTNEPHWRISSQPRIYTRDRCIVAVFESEGIVFLRYDVD